MRAAAVFAALFDGDGRQVNGADPGDSGGE
ncbi:hypothetical protein SAMN05216368_11119 [Cryobacterium flavum]|uniref:Uncharacterized protein n=1 Tax=Cryobacterium flavum TaxID=1424659 RepID=A0A5E9G1F3_9MICO|nr:hypothetical protein SAMN05216368_11119 [Cryobacterium flavum]